ncbi:MAG: FAD-binding oxidoreductase [Rhizomicrobium sp.]
MTTEKHIDARALTAARRLSHTMQDRIIRSGDERYEAARTVWNGAVDHRPALIVCCETAADIQAAVRVARANGLALSVRGGGHDWAGRSVRQDALVVDLSRMRGVEIDLPTQTAFVQGGARVADVAAAAMPYGLTVAGGNSGSVGMAGFTLGGGYGPLMPRFGLGLDNLLGAEIVLADGRTIWADATEHPELFWALRGGGGNFGVTARMRVRLHPVREFLSGVMLFPIAQAATVLCGYAEFAKTAPDEMAVMTGLMCDPAGNPAVFFLPAWSGAPVPGAAAIAGLRALGTPLHEQIGPTPYGEMLAANDALAIGGRRYAIQSRSLAALSPQAAAAILDAYAMRTSPHAILAIHHFRGAPTRIPLQSTAFGLRREHFMVEIIAAWEANATAQDATHRRWARETSRMLAPHALAGGYPNLLGPEEVEQTRDAFGANHPRLCAAKRLFDPDGVFSAVGLPA